MSTNNPNARARLPVQRDHFHPDNRLGAKPGAPTAGQSHGRIAVPGKGPAETVSAVVSRRAFHASNVLRAMTVVASSVASVASRSVASTLLLATSAGRRFTVQEDSEDELAALHEASRHSAVSTRLATLAGLTPEEELNVRCNTPDRCIHQAGAEIVREGENASRPMIIASGWACRVRTAGGRRRIIGLLLPGDGIALRGGSGSLSSTTVATLTTVETVDAGAMLEMAEHPSRNPGVRAAMNRVQMLEEEFLHNQVARLGAMTAPQRLSHLLLELHWRLRQAGLATAREANLPLDHDVLGDLLAMQPPAVCRTMRALQRQNMIRNSYGRLSLLDVSRLRKLSGFEPPPPMERGRTRRLIRDTFTRDWRASTR